MLDFQQFLSRPEMKRWRDHFIEAINRRSDAKRHGDLKEWLKTVATLPSANPSSIDFTQNRITIGKANDLNTEQHKLLSKGLMALSPWRKGPFELFGIHIDTEWRSDWKWQRVSPHISDLSKRTVLDVGCGNGYHCWRMLGAGASYVMGIDPSMRFMVQHTAINLYAQETRFDLLPIGIEDMPEQMPVFDTVFSMGVLYHRRNPINHLIELSNLINSGGELVLETLIVDDIDILVEGTLQPTDRYAQMRNVWSVMTVSKILGLLEQAGFKNSRCVDQNVTSLDEQRSTAWMQYHSLQDFLDPNDLTKTIEGYPAPKRGIFIAEK